MLSKRRLIILLLLIVAVAAGVTYYLSSTQAATAGDEVEEPVQTAIVRRGTLVVSATGAGAVIPAQQVALSFSSNGRLSELLVQVGDRVKAGDVLARMDDTAARKTLANAELQLAQARMQTEATATETGISYDEINIATAEMNLAEAEATLTETAQIILEQAQRELTEAQAAYDQAFEPGRDWELSDPQFSSRLEAERAGAAEQLQRAQDNLASVEASYSEALAGSASAETSMLSTEQNLADAQNGPTIAAAEQAVERARLALQQAQLNREVHTLSLAQTELAVTDAETALASMSLIAPIDGTVLAVNAAAGESVNGAVVVLADLSRPMLEIFLDETDLDKVGPGYEVEIVFDALPEETFTGQVVRVDPQLARESGVSAVRALVEVAYTRPEPLPVGLSATVDVISGRAENALLVPVEAVREISPGQHSLFVMKDGQPQLRMIEVGLMDFTFAEITAGIKEGDVVTTGLVKTD